MTQTYPTPSVDRHVQEIFPSTTVEKSVDKLTVKLVTGTDVRAVDALGLLSATKDLLLDALPQDASKRVADFLAPNGRVRTPEASKAADAAQARAHAASYERAGA